MYNYKFNLLFIAFLKYFRHFSIFFALFSLIGLDFAFCLSESELDDSLSKEPLQVSFEENSNLSQVNKFLTKHGPTLLMGGALIVLAVVIYYQGLQLSGLAGVVNDGMQKQSTQLTEAVKTLQEAGRFAPECIQSIKVVSAQQIPGHITGFPESPRALHGNTFNPSVDGFEIV